MVYNTIEINGEIVFSSSDITRIDLEKEKLKEEQKDFKIFMNVSMLGIKELVYEYKNGVE